MRKLLAIALIAILILSAACTVTNEMPDDATVLYSFEDRTHLPARIISNAANGDTQYAYLISNYGRNYFYIAKGDKVGDLDWVYLGDDNRIIREIDADDQSIVWFERIQNDDLSVNYQIRRFDREQREIKTIYETYMAIEKDTAALEEDEFQEYQMRYLKILGRKVIFMEYDWAAERACIMSLDFDTLEKRELISADFYDNPISDNTPITFFNVKENILVTSIGSSGGTTLLGFDLDKMEVSSQLDLPDYIDMVYYADYDKLSDRYAVYYHHKQTDEIPQQKNEKTDIKEETGTNCIGVITSAEQLKELITFDKGNYIYLRRVGINGDEIFYSQQITTTNVIPNRYRGIRYNLQTGQSKTLPHCFDLQWGEDNYFGLCFDKNKSVWKINYFAWN